MMAIKPTNTPFLIFLELHKINLTFSRTHKYKYLAIIHWYDYDVYFFIKFYMVAKSQNEQSLAYTTESEKCSI